MKRTTGVIIAITVVVVAMGVVDASWFNGLYKPYLLGFGLGAGLIAGFWRSA
jgi:hypothetical protein